MRIAIILGGGDGTRAGGPLPKQFQELDGKTVLYRSLEPFLTVADRVYLVLHPSFLEDWESICGASCENVRIVCGGRTRFDSVKNALLMIVEDGYSSDDLIAVHDGARPLVTQEMIEEGYSLATGKGAAIPVVPVTDSLRRLDTEGGSRSVERKDYVYVQTPQVFAAHVLMRAYEQPYNPSFTDDASVAEANGVTVYVYPGSERNIKITHPMDFRLAGLLLEK